MTNFDSRTDRGYRFTIEINQVNSTQVRARLIIINGYNRFQLWTVTGSMTVDGQKFTYSGQPYFAHSYMRIVLIDKTISVSKKTISVSASFDVPTGRYYLPINGHFTIGSTNYTLPKFVSSSGTPSSFNGLNSI